MISSMTNLFSILGRFFLAACLTMALSTGQLPAQAKPAVNAEEILRMVRMSQALQTHDVLGTIRNKRTGKAERFALTMRQDLIRFRFDNPAQILSLNLQDKGTKMVESLAGKESEVSSKRGAESIRDFDLNYDDLSMRFLYWPNPQFVAMQKIKSQDAYQVRVYNPDKTAPYQAVEVWVHENSGAMLRMQAYNKEGKVIKRYEVNSGQKLDDGTWMLKEMLIETLEPGTNKALGRSSLEVDKAQKVKG